MFEPVSNGNIINGMENASANLKIKAEFVNLHDSDEPQSASELKA